MSISAMLMSKAPAKGPRPLTKAVVISDPVWAYMGIDMVAAAYKGDIYTYGGLRAGGGEHQVLGKYSPKNNTWEVVNTAGPNIGLNSSRNMTLVGDRFYFHRVAAKRVDYYDILTNTWGFYNNTSSDKLSRTGFVEFDGGYYLIGPSGNFTQTNKFSITDATNATWQNYGLDTGINWTMPNVMKWENGVIILGGNANGFLSTTIQKINLVSKTAQQLGALTTETPRYLSPAMAYAEKCYLFGGLSSLSSPISAASDAVLEYDPVTNTRIDVKLRLPDKRINCGIATTEDGVFLFGGRNELNVPQNNIIKLT